VAVAIINKVLSEWYSNEKKKKEEKEKRKLADQIESLIDCTYCVGLILFGFVHYILNQFFIELD
jgi:tetrahydromethanopterin S-methyltransferase subunit H